ncbi:MAG: AAA family ATPase [Desulfobacterales bacterium]|nr:AAA family ATPase [Desulfobacterales bacterium]
MPVSALSPDRLYHRCDPQTLSFETTDELDPKEDSIGQPRAAESLRFGIGIAREGYNIFALGEPGTGKYTLIRSFLDKRAKDEHVPPDICYVKNFEDDHRPKILMVEPGSGKALEKDMKEMVENVRRALRAAFENEDYQNRRQSIKQELQEKQQKAFEELQKKAEEDNLTIMRTPSGLSFAPVKDEEVISPEEYEKLPEEERKHLEERVQELQKEAGKIFQQIPQWQRKIGEKQKELDREVSQYAVGPVIEELIKKYEDNEKIVEHLKDVEKDIIDNLQAFRQPQGGQQNQLQQMIQQQMGGGQGIQEADADSQEMRKYHVNVLVDNSSAEGAPVVYEENPTYQNLIGRVEHQAHMGTLFTDFDMIRAGALHRANGGYLILDALKVLRDPFAWEGLKRALKSGEIKIESLGQMYSLISTVSLEPEPFRMKIKVVLMGQPLIYYLIRHFDPEFSELFKVAADFAHQMDRNEKNQNALAGLIAGAVKHENMHPFSRGAVARVIEHSARTVGDGEKLSVHMQRLTDLLREADYWASENGNGKVEAEDVQKAIDSWIYRSDRLRERMQEQIDRGIVFVDTEGAKVGQINGLSVIGLGEFMFGRPARITARTSMGKGSVVDIEREVDMGGPIHSKGVLILGGYLRARYAWEHPMSLSASLVFEQSYGGIEGDSASSAELYALLSAISKIPIKQSFAVTGSVNQHGQVQPIGGVNEKIEGFFDTCHARGLTGEQGVLIPESNVSHLMLRRDVIEAVEKGQFHIYAVQTIDEGIELLTGMEAGEADDQGYFPENTVNGIVYKRLAEMAKKRLDFMKPAVEKEGE